MILMCRFPNPASSVSFARGEQVESEGGLPLLVRDGRCALREPFAERFFAALESLPESSVGSEAHFARRCRLSVRGYSLPQAMRTWVDVETRRERLSLWQEPPDALLGPPEPLAE